MTASARPLARVGAPAAHAFPLGSWHVEPGLGRISTEAMERVVEPKVMDVLVHLAARPGDVVSTDELIASVWHGRPMGDNPVHRCVSILRRALGDDAHRPRYIDTIPKRGYRVVAPVEPMPLERLPAPTVHDAPAANHVQAQSIALRIDVRSLDPAVADAVRDAASARVPGAAARSAGEVLECVLRMGGRELHITAIVAGNDGVRPDGEGLRMPQIEHLLGVVRSIVRDTPPASG